VIVWTVITARVISLRHVMSGVLCVDEWMTEPRYTNWSSTATCWPWTEIVGGQVDCYSRRAILLLFNSKRAANKGGVGYVILYV